MSKAICSECGSSVEIADGKEWGYCPMCENDQVEVKIGNSNGDFVDLLNKEMYELKIADLEAKLAESEKKHLLDEKEWQDYCSYKIIEPQIKGCLDREREYKKQLAEKDEEIKQLTFQINVKDGENAELERRIYELDGNGFCSGECWCCDYFKDGNDGYSVCTYKANQDKISFAVEQLEQLRHDIWTNQADDGYTDMQVDLYELNDVIDVRIMQIKEGK